MRPIEHIDTAVAELNPNLDSYRNPTQRQETASAHALVAIAQLIEAQNHILERITDAIPSAGRR